VRKKASPQRRQLHREMETYGVRVPTARAICEYADKAIYTSESDAKKGQRGMHAKDMRPYRCPDNPGHFHLTKDWKVKW
jgi:hypothetical protein